MDERKRILIFVHDGRGLGHLRRLCRLADQLKHDASVLFVTGHRDASYLVPKDCEYIRRHPIACLKLLCPISYTIMSGGSTLSEGFRDEGEFEETEEEHVEFFESGEDAVIAFRAAE